MADENDRPLGADHPVDEAPEELGVGLEAVGLGARIVEFFGIAHADQIGRDSAAEPRNLRHHRAPQIGRGRVAVEEQKHPLAGPDST